MPEVDSNDEEYLPTANLDDPVWPGEPMPDSQEYLWIHKIPRPASPPLQLSQVDMPPEPVLMELATPEDISDLTDIPEEVL